MVGKIKVLVVDDDVNFGNTLSKILFVKGYEVSTLRDGFATLDLVRQQEFDVVLMDIKMPVMNGVETYKKIKAIKPNLWVILMTAFSVDALIQDAMKEGVYAVIRKPFEVDSLISMIERSKEGALLAIVDDDPNICKTMQLAIEKKGYSVTTCLTGEEIIACTKDRPYDIYFIDIKLPVLNGLETYMEIKKINSKAIVVMMTGYRQEADELIQQGFQNGVYACLYKPFDMDAVIKIIEDISNKKQH
jgi:two-component system, NtrC family, response regulator HydG